MKNSNNPVIKGVVQERYSYGLGGDTATFTGILNKTGLSLAGIAVVAAAAFMMLPVQLLTPALIVSGLAGIVTVFIVTTRKVVTPAMIGVYALIEGVFVGAATKLFEMMYPGIALQAVVATFLVAGATWSLYRLSGFRVTAKFRRMVVIGTLAMLALYLVNLGLRLFGVDTGIIEVGGGAGLLSWGVSAVAVTLATLNLVLDFDDAQTVVERGAPVSTEWRVALGIAVTLVWLYVELLRILSYFRD